MKTHERSSGPADMFLLRWHPFLWIALAGLVVYLRTLAFGFTGLDDNALITNNYAFLSDAANVFRAFGQKVFLQSVLPYYRPLLLVSFIVDAHIGGLSPVVYHAHNLLIHLFASCLVFTFLIRFGAAREWSFFCALIFAVHPALVQAVAWVPGRNDSLVTVFCLASFISFFGLLRTPKVRWYLLHLLFFALALFTKESALMLVALTTLYLFLIGPGALTSRGRWALWSGYAVVGAGWFFARQAAVAGSMEISLYDLARYLGAYLPAVVQFVGKAVLPVHLAVFPTMQNTPFIFGAVAMAGILAVLIIARPRRYRVVIFGLAWFLAFLLPSLARPHAGVINDVLQHRLYLPMVGLGIMLSAVSVPEGMRRWMRIGGVFVIILFAWLAIRHSYDFRDRFSFWENAVAASPDSPYAHLLLGTVYYDDDRVEGAEKALTRAIALDNQLMRAHYFLGLTYMKKMMYRRAAQEFRKEIALHPRFDAAYSSLAAARYHAGEHEDLPALWRQAIERNPDNLEAYRNLAIYCAQTGDTEGARWCVGELERRGVVVPADFLERIKGE